MGGGGGGARGWGGGGHLLNSPFMWPVIKVPTSVFIFFTSIKLPAPFKRPISISGGWLFNRGWAVYNFAKFRNSYSL